MFSVAVVVHTRPIRVSCFFSYFIFLKGVLIVVSQRMVKDDHLHQVKIKLGRFASNH